MIPLPTPPVRGQRIQADLLRDLIDAVRRCRPIQGQGILLQETLQGTVITLAGRPKTAADTLFDHRFKVTCRAEGEADAPTYALLIRKGSLYEVQDGKATEEELTLEGLTQAPDDSDAWRVANASAGSLYIRNETAEGKEGYTLAYGEPTDALFVIADFTPSASSSEPFPKVTQRILGDVYAFVAEASDAAPAAWTIRRRNGAWQLYSPVWAYGRNSAEIASGYTNGWNDLPATLATASTLYAWMQWFGTKDSETGAVTWSPDTAGPYLTNKASDIPRDTDASGGVTNPVPGVRVRIVQIGSFTDALGVLVWAPLHVGTIVESGPAADGAQGEQGPQGEKGDPGANGTDGTDGVDGDTYTPSLREVAGTGGGVYIDFTSANTGAVIAGTVDIRGPQGEQGEQGPQGPQGPKGDPGDGADLGSPLSLSVVTGVKYSTATHKLTATVRQITFYGTLGAASTVDITTATPHSGEH